ncbi:MAG: TetR family transcriptional regulator [Gemmatimonadota bacterium]
MDAAEALILDHGFAGTAVDAVVERAGVTKGAFFHHFSSKSELAHALVERYSELDEEMLEGYMGRAERLSRDPLQQLLIFVGLFEEAMAELTEPYPGCLLASYIYEAGLFDREVHGIIRRTVETWRSRLGAKVREAAEAHPPRVEADLSAVADQMWVVAEGAFILSKEMREPAAVAAQLREYRNYLELLFGAA